MVNPQLGRDRGKPRIGCPQSHAGDKSGREQVRVDPANAAAVKSTLPNELYNLTMWHDRRLVHQDVVGDQLLTPSFVADEEFAENKVVPACLASVQKVFEFACVRRSVRQEPNPD
jgi:hypothetical protein